MTADKHEFDKLRDDLADKISAASAYAHFGNRQDTAASADAIREATKAFAAFAEYLAGFVIDSGYIWPHQYKWFCRAEFEPSLMQAVDECVPSSTDILEYYDEDRPGHSGSLISNQFGFTTHTDR